MKIIDNSNMIVGGKEQVWLVINYIWLLDITYLIIMSTET